MSLYNWQIKLVKEGKCWHCSGNKTVSYRDPNEDNERYWKTCPHCGGLGTPTAIDLQLVAMIDTGTCPRCNLALVEGHDIGSRIEPCGKNDCLAHVIQYIHMLEDRILKLEATTVKFDSKLVIQGGKREDHEG